MRKSPDPTDKHVGLAHAEHEAAHAHAAAKLQHISNFLQVPIPFFFEGLPDPGNTAKPATGIPDHVSEFIATSDGLSLIRAYTQIKRRNLREAIVALVEKLAS